MKNNKPPKETAADIVHSIVRAGLGAIPFGGTAAIEIFSKVILPPIEKRRYEWAELIGKRLKMLEDKGILNIEDLKKNDKFITTVMHASQAAIRNHQKEKIEALRNAIINSALPNSPDENLQLLFLNLIDTFSPWHLRVLDYFKDDYCEIDIKNFHSSVIEHLLTKFTTFESKRQFNPIFLKPGSRVMMSTKNKEATSWLSNPEPSSLSKNAPTGNSTSTAGRRRV